MADEKNSKARYRTRGPLWIGSVLALVANREYSGDQVKASVKTACEREDVRDDRYSDAKVLRSLLARKLLEKVE